MNCAHCRRLLDAFVDGEVDAGTASAIDRHLGQCAECRALRDERNGLAALLGAARDEDPMPSQLTARVRRALAEEPDQQARERRPTWTQAIAIAAGAAAIAVAVTLAAGRFTRAPTLEVLVDRHVAALAAVPATGAPALELVASERHQLKPWFQGRVPLSPPVADLSGAGYELVGGRIERLGSQPAAVVIYRIRRHPIELFAWRDAGRSSAPRAQSLDGFNVVRWEAEGLAFAAVSDLNAAELERFARAVAESGS
jgi:anti-sigma factor RsiW